MHALTVDEHKKVACPKRGSHKDETTDMAIPLACIAASHLKRLTKTYAHTAA